MFLTIIISQLLFQAVYICHKEYLIIIKENMIFLYFKYFKFIILKMGRILI